MRAAHTEEKPRYRDAGGGLGLLHDLADGGLGFLDIDDDPAVDAAA